MQLLTMNTLKERADLGWTSLLCLLCDQASADEAALLHQSEHHLDRRKVESATVTSETNATFQRVVCSKYNLRPIENGIVSIGFITLDRHLAFYGLSPLAPSLVGHHDDVTMRLHQM